MSDDDSVKKILSYQESCDAGESVRSISGWFQKAKKAKRRVRDILLSLVVDHVLYLSFDPKIVSFSVQKHHLTCAIVLRFGLGKLNLNGDI